MHASDIERLGNWEVPPLVGNSAGSPASGVFTMVPGTPLLPATFTAKGAAPYANGYFLTRLGATSGSHFTYRHDFMFPTSGDLSACQAYEFELQHSDGTQFWNMAFQAAFKEKPAVWRIFNKTKEQWESTTIPVTQIVSGLWNRVIAEFVHIGGPVWHIGVTINEDWYPIMLPHPAVPVSGGTPYLNAAIQLDSNGLQPPTPYKVLVQNACVEWE